MSDSSPEIWICRLKAISNTMTDKIIQKFISLRPYNTFGIDIKTDYFAILEDRKNVCDFFGNEVQKFDEALILGGGSNVLFVRDFKGIVLHIKNKGIEVISKDSDFVWLCVQAGENWHDLVTTCVSNGWGGIENLALIPGTCGAAPIQNIGAYGVELKDVLEEVEVWDRTLAQVRVFKNQDCQFGYRESRFKQEPDRYVVLSIVLKLSLRPVLNTSYSAIANYLNESNITPSLESIYRSVIEIRRSKLPDPQVLGNCGSFFKNPIVSRALYQEIARHYPNVPSFPHDNEAHVKIPAGWLIEQCGWKGKTIGNVGCYPKQALVLVNATGQATGSEVWEFAQRIQADVKEKFGISLSAEVRVLT